MTAGFSMISSSCRNYLNIRNILKTILKKNNKKRKMKQDKNKNKKCTYMHMTKVGEKGSAEWRQKVSSCVYRCEQWNYRTDQSVESERRIRAARCREYEKNKCLKNKTKKNRRRPARLVCRCVWNVSILSDRDSDEIQSALRYYCSFEIVIDDRGAGVRSAGWTNE